VTTIVPHASDGARQFLQVGATSDKENDMKKEKQLKAIDAHELAEIRGGTFYPPPWVEEPVPEPWRQISPIVPIAIGVGVIQAR
jgi:hypothetical protein